MTTRTRTLELTPGLEVKVPSSLSVALFEGSRSLHIVDTRLGGTVEVVLLDGIRRTVLLTRCARRVGVYAEPAGWAYTAAVVPVRLLDLAEVTPCRRCFP